MDYLLELGAAMSRFAELQGEATGDEQVPACPGWTSRQLTEHLGSVHRWAASIVLSGQRVETPKPLFGDPLVEWYAGTATALLSALQAVSVDEPTPNFSRNDEHAGFWRRRQMHEATVHTVDAAQALGLDESHWTLAPPIAADGVEEVLRIFLPRMTARGQAPDVRSRIRLTATDAGQSWVIAPAAGRDSRRCWCTRRTTPTPQSRARQPISTSPYGIECRRIASRSTAMTASRSSRDPRPPDQRSGL